MLNRVSLDLSSRRNDINDGMVLTDDGRAFQARVAAYSLLNPTRGTISGGGDIYAYPRHSHDVIFRIRQTAAAVVRYYATKLRVVRT